MRARALSLGLLAASVALLACDSKKSEFFEPIPASGGGGFSDAATGGITGVVTLDGVALPGVGVALGAPADRSATTDGEGRFSFEGLDPGSYALLLAALPVGVVCPGSEASVAVVAGELAVVDFGCAAVGGIQGTVLLNGTGYETVDVGVVGPDTALVQTGSGGLFELGSVPVGTYTVRLESLPPEVVCDHYELGVTVTRAETSSVSFLCTTVPPPTFDDVMGFYDVDYSPVLTTCEASIDPFSVIGELKPDYSVDPPGVDFQLPNTLAPIWGYYVEESGVLTGDFMWHDDAPGVETNEFWVASFFVNPGGTIAFAGSAIVIFREVMSEAEVCRREYHVSGSRRP